MIPQYEAVWHRLRFHPKRPASGFLPLGMDYPAVFAGHFGEPTATEAPLRWVSETAVPIYVHAELKALFNEAHVQQAMAWVQSAELSRSQLRARLQTQGFAPGLRGQIASQMLVAWLLKHGLVSE